MIRRERSPLTALVAVLGIGLLAACYLLWDESQAGDERGTRITQLERENAADRQESEELQRLVRRLQEQVRDLGGIPATAAPTPAASRPAADPTPAAPTSAPPRAGRTPAAPSPQPRPSQPSVSPRPTATPSPTPSCVKVGPISVCPGG